MTKWKTIPGYDENYLVSDDGRVWSNYVKRELTIYDTCGYSTVHIRSSDGKKLSARIHRLVAFAFLGNSEKPYINHKNGNKKDNRLENLEWITPSDNILHSYYSLDNGNTTLRGKKLTKSEKEEIVRQHNDGIKIVHTLKQFNISLNLYRRITNTKECNTKIGINTEFKLENNERIKKVSDYDNYWISDLGNVYSSNTGHTISQHLRNEYSFVHLYKGGLSKNFYVHRLVAIHFVDRPKGKNFVNHIDENRLNNNANNLEWVTHSENISHSMRKTRKISDEKILQVQKLHSDGLTALEIAKLLEMGRTTVYRIIHKTGRFKELR